MNLCIGLTRDHPALNNSRQFPGVGAIRRSLVECRGDQYCTDSVAQIRTASGLQKSRLSLIDTYTKMSFAKLYDRKTPITAADLLNDRVLPFFDEPARQVFARSTVSSLG